MPILGIFIPIMGTISRQVSGLAQLPDDLKFIVDQESNTKYAQNGHMGIWAYVKKYGQVGYPLRKHQKWNSETLTSGP